MQMSGATAWTYTALTVKPTADYSPDGPPWGEGTDKIKWIGNDSVRVTTMAAAELAFDGLTWKSGVPWPAAFKDAYSKVLRTFFSLPALRALVMVHGGELDGEVVDRTTIVTVCLDGEFPLCTPEYLKGYMDEVRSVASGARPGGCVFDGPSGVVAHLPAPIDPAAELAALKLRNTILEEENKRKRTEPTVSPACTMHCLCLSMSVGSGCVFMIRHVPACCSCCSYCCCVRCHGLCGCVYVC
jgi:hypothetical protein